MQAKQQIIFMAAALLVVAGVAIGPEFAASCAVMTGLFFGMRKYVAKCTTAQKWFLAVLSVLVVAPGSLWLTAFAAGILAAIFMVKGTMPQTTYVTAMSVLGVFSAINLIPVDAFADTHSSLSGAIGSLKGALNAAAGAVPVFGYVAGAGFGGSGLVEIVKSKNGQGGDFGAGMKKVLIGGGLAGLGGMLDMTSQDMTGSKSLSVKPSVSG